MNRKEHLDWCKQRALEYVETGDAKNALASMMSDLRKHDETKNHPRIETSIILAMGGYLDTLSQVKEFIEGFN